VQYFTNINETNEEYNINFMNEYKVIEIPNQTEQILMLLTIFIKKLLMKQFYCQEY